MNSLKIAVVGGGVTGLTAAYILAKARRSGAPADEFLIEGSQRLGGLVLTERVGDFVVEGGPDSFLSEKPEARALCEELGLGGELIGSNDASRQTYVLHRGRLEPLPDGFLFFVPSRPWSALKSPLLSPSGKLAVLRNFFWQSPAKGEVDESVASFVRRRFGQDFLDDLVQPLLAGVYGGNPEELSAQAVLGRLLALEREHGSIVRAAIRLRHKRRASGPLFTTLRSGLGTLIEALGGKLRSEETRFELGRRVVRLEAGLGAVRRYRLSCDGGDSYEADAVILALPAFECARLLQPHSAELAVLLGGVHYTAAATVNLGFLAAPALPPGFGFLVPKREGRKLLACTFVHAKFPGRVPAGSALLRCFFGGAQGAAALETSDEELLQTATRELRAVLGLEPQADFHRIFRWPRALPQYAVGHKVRVRATREKLNSLPGLFLGGNAYAGVGISDCVRSGKEAAEAAIKYAEGWKRENSVAR